MADLQHLITCAQENVFGCRKIINNERNSVGCFLRMKSNSLIV